MRECDVVMKGGITSGVVYPMAVYELSKTYRFRNIGGTSAGAIAATLTAAAEFRRQTQSGPDSNAGFETLKALPAWLQSNENLKNLFQPSRTTHPIFTFVLSLLLSQQASWLSRIITSVFASMYRIAAIAPLVVSAAVLFRIWSVPGDALTKSLCTVVTLVCTAGIFVAAPLIWAGMDLLKTVPDNKYGMCSGMPGPYSGGAALTPWLADKIDDVAGNATGGPLTFGDLWNARNPSIAPDSVQSPTERNINIEMVTTNITYGRPFTLPFESAESRFYFAHDELNALFPKRIVTWMEEHPRPDTDEHSPARRRALRSRGLFPFPAPEDIPIVVAARMSLSFPVLLCAVPLHAVDWNLKHNAQNPETPLTRNCWFSDGGLSSNFPIQFFDAPIPGRPTFGINLRSFDDTYAESPDERNNVWMPEFNDDVISNSRNGFDDKGANLPGFLSAIIDTMQNWNDNLQAQVPGFRDRIVHVFLSAAEGGLNLDMPENVLATLSRRGECAGDLLVQRFTSPSPEAPPQTTNWENHRWVRFRTATSVLEQFVVDFTTRYLAPPDNGDTAYPDLVQRKPGVAPFGYALGVPEQQRFVAAQTAALASSGIVWANAAPNDFREDSPEPMPELQVRPRI